MKIKILGPNQTELHTGDKIIFFSYNTPVAARVRGKIVVTDTHYSQTTSKHINRWLNGATYLPARQTWLDKLLD